MIAGRVEIQAVIRPGITRRRPSPSLASRNAAASDLIILARHRLATIANRLAQSTSRSCYRDQTLNCLASVIQTQITDFFVLLHSLHNKFVFPE